MDIDIENGNKQIPQRQGQGHPMQGKPVPKKQPQQKQGFLQSLLDGIFNSSNPEAEKKRRLKVVAKNFQKSRYHNFYKTSTLEVLPPFAKLFFEIYKIISPAQAIFRTEQAQTLFKRQILNYSLSEKQSEILEELDANRINELGRQVPFTELTRKVNEQLAAFSDEFTPERMAKTENLYRTFLLFKDFCTFDYYLMLKKFNSRIQENNFSSVPSFDKINAEYIVDDLKDFVEVAYMITDDKLLWNDLFDFIKATRGGTEVVGLNNWKKIIAKVRSLQASFSLDLMIRHISSNPLYEPLLKIKFDSIVEPYIDKLQEETNSVLSKINYAQKESKASTYCTQIFGNTNIQTLHHYIASFNEVLAKKDLSQFLYAEPLNYLKAFLVEYLKTDIREYYEVVCIRGQWDASLSAPMSNAYQELLRMSDEIADFDNALSEEGTMGLKIKTLLPKTAHDPGAENIINRVVSDSNELAKRFMVNSVQNFILIGKTLKQLIEDYMKPKPEIVQNWKELEKFFEKPLKEFSVNIYKKIYLFVQLMQQYLTD